MALEPFNLPIAYGATDVVKGSGGWLTNIFAEAAPPDAKTPVNLIGAPGLRLFCLLPDTDVLQGVEINNAAYFVTKDGFYRVFPDGGYFKLGNVQLDPLCSLASNGIHVVCTDGKQIFSYEIRDDELHRYNTQAPFQNFVTELTNNPNYYPANTVTFLDQLLIFDRAHSSQFYNTMPLSLTVDPAAFSSGESQPDDVVAVKECQQQLFVIGNRTYEVFYNSGTGRSPFVRVQGAVGDYGTTAPYTVQTMRNTVLWVTHDRQVIQVAGYAPQIISTQAITDELEKISELSLSTAQAWMYSLDGHDFYVLTFADKTFVYDLVTGLWHRRRDLLYERHRGICSIYAYGRVLVGSVDGAIYQMSNLYYSDADTPLVAEIVTPPIDTAFRNVGYPRFEIDIDTAFLSPWPDVPARVGLEISNDGGRSWGVQRLRSIGNIGDTLQRVKWLRNGSGRQRRWRISMSDPVPRRMTSRAWLETS